VYGDLLAALVFEDRPGGRVFERSVEGEEATWGTVTAWSPPSGFTMTWHPGRGPDTAQTLEVRFEPDGTGTRVTLLQTGWERPGAEASETHRGYGTGWVTVFDGAFGAAADREA
jgi:uncharacterized protein YndB with AHSA1/START domain